MSERESGVAIEAPAELTEALREPGGILTEEEANAIYDRGREAVVFALLTLAKERTELAQKLEQAKQPGPSTPSGMIPVYQKPACNRRGKKPGRQEGHEGSRRGPPVKIDHHREHMLERCPDCGGPVSKTPTRKRKRIIEEIPEVQPEVTEHTICGYWCGTCHKTVESVVVDALPGATIGNHLLALTAWLHYGLGQTLSQIVAVLNFHLNFRISEGGLVQMWYRLQEILYGWYEQIGRDARSSAVLHADETGWRVGGKTHWLWCFTSAVATYYLIDRSRGQPALKKFFTEAFEGTLITDFWGPYEKVQAAFKQKCLVHLFREFEKVEVRNKSPAWVEFRKKLKRLLRDALRLNRREGMAESEHASRRARLDERLDQVIDEPWTDPDARRLSARLCKYRHELLTFLDQPGLPSDNNQGEREIRPAVIIRKNSLCNRSHAGAEMQAVMMSIYRTLKLRGHDPIRSISAALREYLATGKLPPLPAPATSLG